MLRLRYRRITGFFARHLLNFIFCDLFLPTIGLRSWSERTRMRRMLKMAAAFRQLAIQMGGVMIKVGQFLSSRVDILPPEIVAELAGLQDEVPAVTFSEIKKLAEAELGASLSEKFLFFDEVPLAAASLGQVHRASLKDLPNSAPNQADSSVVVKIQRPNIELLIRTDLKALRTVSTWLKRYPPLRRRMDVDLFLDEFTRVLYEEIDYLHEGDNAERFAKLFLSTPNVRVPRVYWSHTTRRVLTLENVYGIKIVDYEKISAAGISRQEVASRLLDTYLKQIFEDGFFHADPHPGNLFVTPLETGASPSPTPPSESSNAWELTFVDFGMTGQVPENVRRGLREMLIGIGTQDAHRVVQSYKILGILLPSADVDQLEKAGAMLFERFWGKSMDELRNISPEEVLSFVDEFRDLMFTLPFQVPTNLIFLGRTVAILSGICTGLDPNFNVWSHIEPYARQILASEATQSGNVWLKELLKVLQTAVTLPTRLDRTLSLVERGEVKVKVDQLERLLSRLNRSLHLVAHAIVSAALLLSSVYLISSGERSFGLVLGGITLLFFGFYFRLSRRD